MKKLLFIGVIALSFMSCTLTSHMSNDLSANYQLKMTSKKEKALVEKIPIYLCEKDIQGEFTVKSINSYNPFVFPVLGSRKKIVSKRLFAKAVKAAAKQKGNAVLIVGDSQFKILTVK